MNTDHGQIYSPAMSFESLCEQYPEIWKHVEPRVIKTLESCQPKAIVKHVVAAKAVQKKHAKALLGYQSQASDRHHQLVWNEIVASRMEELAFEKFFEALALKAKTQSSGSTNKGIGSVYQKFLRPAEVFAAFMLKPYFGGKRVRRHALKDSWGHGLWSLLKPETKSQILQHAYRSGVYCVYTEQFIAELAREIGNEPCLEIGAGDGTLSRLLRLLAPPIKLDTTDDYSWKHSIAYPPSVVKLDANAALKTYQPKVVLCLWPPANNGFEQEVFATKSVAKYIVFGSRLSFATGNIAAYKSAKQFSWEASLTLTRLVFPAEVAPAAYVFRRIAT